MADDAALWRLLMAIASADDAGVLEALTASPALARAALAGGAARTAATDKYLTEISHYVYAGDTALHVAAAAHRPEIARELVRAGAGVSTRNRRGATPMMLAMRQTGRGGSGSPEAKTQQAEIIRLLERQGAAH